MDDAEKDQPVVQDRKQVSPYANGNKVIWATTPKLPYRRDSRYSRYGPIRTSSESSGLRLPEFNDRPLGYFFTNLIKDVELSPSVEMDLLVKWLGPQSAKLAERINSIHVYNPTAGLCKT